MNYQFIFRYELMVGSSTLFTELSNIQIDVLGYFRENHDQVKIDGEGRVKMVYIQYIDDLRDFNDERPKEQQTIPCRLLAAIFQKQEHLEESKCFNIDQMFDFPIDAKNKMDRIREHQMKMIRNKINNIRMA